MTKPKYKIGDSIIVKSTTTGCDLTRITNGYFQKEENKWEYWTEASGGMGGIGYVKEEDVISNEKEMKIKVCVYQKEKCEHIFKLQKIETEQIPEGVASTGVFYRKVGYVVCEKCGYIIKQDL